MCDTRLHVASECADWRADDVGGVVPGQCSRPVPALTCVAGNCGVRSSGKKPKRVPFHPGAQARGRPDGRTSSEPPLMPRYPEPREMGWRPGCRAWPWRNGKRRPENFRRSCEHRWPRGRGGAHPGRSSRMRNVRTPSGSGTLSGVAGKPEVTKAQSPGGNRMLKKRTPVRRKATGNRDKRSAPPLIVPHNRPDAGPRPAPKGR